MSHAAITALVLAVGSPLYALTVMTMMNRIGNPYVLFAGTFLLTLVAYGLYLALVPAVR